MTDVENFKKEAPETYNQIFALGEIQGISKERDRVNAWMTFMQADKSTAMNAIKDGTKLHPAQMATLAAKVSDNDQLSITEFRNEVRVSLGAPPIK